MNRHRPSDRVGSHTESVLPTFNPKWLPRKGSRVTPTRTFSEQSEGRMGQTAIVLRYRGLGKVQIKFEADGAEMNWPARFLKEIATT